MMTPYKISEEIAKELFPETRYRPMGGKVKELLAFTNKEMQETEDGKAPGIDGVLAKSIIIAVEEVPQVPTKICLIIKGYTA